MRYYRIGQTVYLQERKPGGHYFGKELVVGTISKIGRNWISVTDNTHDELHPLQFDVTTLQQKPTGYDYGYNYILWLSREEYDEEVKYSELVQNISDYFNSRNNIKHMNIKDLEIISTMVDKYKVALEKSGGYSTGKELDQEQ